MCACVFGVWDMLRVHLSMGCSYILTCMQHENSFIINSIYIDSMQTVYTVWRMRVCSRGKRQPFELAEGCKFPTLLCVNNVWRSISFNVDARADSHLCGALVIITIINASHLLVNASWRRRLLKGSLCICLTWTTWCIAICFVFAKFYLRATCETNRLRWHSIDDSREQVRNSRRWGAKLNVMIVHESS